MNFLEKVGKAGFEGLKIAAPLLATVAGASTSAPLQTIAGLVMAAEISGEKVSQMNGPKLDKLALVAPFAQAALMTSPIMQGKNVTDPQGLQAATEQIISGVVLLLKSIDTNQPQELTERAAASGNQPPTH